MYMWVKMVLLPGLHVGLQVLLGFRVVELKSSYTLKKISLGTIVYTKTYQPCT